MPEEQDKKVSGLEFKTYDIDNWIEAIVYILSGFTFLFRNYKKATLATIIIVSFLFWQYLTNFQQFDNLIGLFGG